jgi:transcription elongation factor GreA
VDGRRSDPGDWERAIPAAKDGVSTPSRRAGAAATLLPINPRPKEHTEMDDLVITREGFDRLYAQLERLKNEERRRVADRLRRATTSEANLSQNMEYLDAREEKLDLERRIYVLRERLREARVVKPRPGNGRVDPGERVRVREVVSGRSLELELVGHLEADVAAGRVSVASPLGQALVGLRKGEIADVVAPRGRFAFEVLAVEVPAPAA